MNLGSLVVHNPMRAHFLGLGLCFQVLLFESSLEGGTRHFLFCILALLCCGRPVLPTIVCALLSMAVGKLSRAKRWSTQFCGVGLGP
jgi:hypothetical protein